jgi:peptidoglycan/LPS O-acetylase OafA/YrhL
MVMVKALLAFWVVIAHRLMILAYFVIIAFSLVLIGGHLWRVHVLMQRFITIFSRLLGYVERTHSSISCWLAAQLETSQEQGTIGTLDGVRAIACLTVMGYHINLMTRSAHLWTTDGKPLTSAVVLAGSSGVTLFFVLSGFLLFLPYAKALLFERSWPDTRLFYLRRILRIIPGYYTSLFLIVVLERPEYLQPERWSQLVLFPLFLMDSTQATFRQLNGPYWTLAIEWQFYMLLPWIALGIRAIVQRLRPERRIWGVVGCLLGLMAWGVLTRYVGAYFMANPTATFLVPRGVLNVLLFITYGVDGKFLEDFAVGMLTGLCYLVVRHAATGRNVVQRVQRLSPWLWGGGVLLCFLMAIQLNGQSWPILGPLFQSTEWLNELGFSLGFGVCILAILFDPFGGLKRFFAWAPLRWIGLISYSLYIWHLPLLVSFGSHIGPNLSYLPAFAAYSLYWLWAVVVIIPFSFAMYMLVEKPGMRLSNKLKYRMMVRRQKTAASIAAGATAPAP